MEVHKDPQHVTHRKKWSEYLLDFLMLFLAVFLGFLAEYRLEHLIEHQREGKLVSSLLEDLKKDTTEISQVNYWIQYQKIMDGLGAEIEKSTSKRNNLSLYKWFSSMREFGNFKYHNRTIEQLKNGGNFRLITIANFSDSLIDYDALIISYLRDQEEQSKAIYQKLNFLQDKFVNAKYYYLRGTKERQLDSIYKAGPAFFQISKANKEYLFEYHNNLEFYKVMTGYRISTLYIMRRMANNLIESIKKNYEIN
ncbi:MAG: hypothetical protein NVSMB67_24650 [Flavisolibacter sp.]